MRQVVRERLGFDIYLILKIRRKQKDFTILISDGLIGAAKIFTATSFAPREVALAVIAATFNTVWADPYCEKLTATLLNDLRNISKQN